MARGSAGNVVGIAAFVLHRTTVRGLIPSIRLEPLGTTWRQAVGEVTEYTDWIIRSGWDATVQRAFAEFIFDEWRWDEFSLTYVREGSPVMSALREVGERRACYVRTEEPLTTYAIDTDGSFEDYLAGLGSNTRLRLFNRRTLLEKEGKVSIRYADPSSLKEIFGVFDELFALRWDRHIAEKRRRFLEDLAGDCFPDGRVRFSILMVGERPISALYNIRAGGTEYYLGSAFDSRFHRKVSPGLLHLGYSIESAFGNEITRYDLLAGGENDRLQGPPFDS